MSIQFGDAYDAEKMRKFAKETDRQLQSHSGQLSKLKPPFILNVNADYTILMADDTVLADCTAGVVTLKLPEDLDETHNGATFTAGKIDAANNLVVDGNGADINGAATYTNSTQWRCDTFKWTGARWIIVAHS